MSEMIFYFTANGDRLELMDKTTALTGNQGTYECFFELNDDWQEFLPFAVFSKEDQVFTTPLLKDNCKIPGEILLTPGDFYVGLYGTKPGGDFKRISTNRQRIGAEQGAYYANAVSPAPNSPDSWELLLVKNIPQIGENGNWYLWDTGTGEYKDSGKRAIGTPGYTPQKGIDYLTPEDIASMGLENKVDKIPGMGLSENNYTTKDQQVVSKLPDEISTIKANTYTKNEIDTATKAVHDLACDALDSANYAANKAEEAITRIDQVELKPGENGISATHQWKGTILEITSASGTSSADLKGEKGEQGTQGEKGEKGEKGDTGAPGKDGLNGTDGYTPKRGTDYWTSADIAEIKGYVDDAILGGAW